MLYMFLLCFVLGVACGAACSGSVTYKRDDYFVEDVEDECY